MSRKNKLRRFADIYAYPNVYENFNPLDPKLVHQEGKTIEMKGLWASQHFGNDHPITMELACGGGEYTVGMAHEYPQRNFIGVDIKGARIWKGATKALKNDLKNVVFLRTRIEQIQLFFAEKEIDQIWITFPDPFPRESKINRRLTSHRFLDQYKTLLVPEGCVHLKTDSLLFYNFTLETLAERTDIHLEYQCDDIYAGPLENSFLEIKTHYEIQHLRDNRTIKYLRFRFL